MPGGLLRLASFHRTFFLGRRLLNQAVDTGKFLSVVSLKLFLNNWPAEQTKSHQELAAELKGIRPDQTVLVIKTLEAEAGAEKVNTILTYLIREDLVGERSVVPCIRLLGQAFSHRAFTADELQVYRRLEQFLPIGGPFATGSRLIFDCCVKNQVPSNFDHPGALVRSCFDALAVYAIRFDKLDLMNKVVSTFSDFNVGSYLHENPVIFRMLLDRISASGCGWFWAYLYMFQGNAVLQDNFISIYEAFERITSTKSLKNARVSNGKCSNCDTLLIAPTITSETFEPLRFALTAFVQKSTQQLAIALKKEFDVLQRVVETIRSKMNEKRESIVVDLLNLQSGQYLEQAGVVQFLLRLQQDFDQVLLVTRPKVLADKIHMLKENGLHVLYVTRYTDDDMFSIVAALNLGSNCFVLSNDRFGKAQKYVKGLKDEQVNGLFHLWLRTRLIGFRKGSLSIKRPVHFAHTLVISEDKSSAHFVVYSNKGTNEQTLKCLRVLESK